MSWLSKLPLKKKITLVILVTCAVVVLLACTSLAVFEYFDSRSRMERDVTVLADILGQNTQAALTFRDSDTAVGLLSSLQSKPYVSGARIFDNAGDIFADYIHPGSTVELPLRPQNTGHRFEHGNLGLYRPIVLDGKPLGTIYLEMQLQEMYDRIGLFAVISGVVLIGSLLLALVLSERMQGLISAPILALAKTAKIIAEQCDYTVRAPREEYHEMGALTEAFNHMLTQIQVQNQTLKEGETRMRAVLNSALSAVVVMDVNGKIIDWNARAESMFGWSRGEALGQELAATIIPQRYREAHRGGLQHFLTSGTGPALNRPMELSALRRDGSELPVELSINSLKTGDVVTFCGFLTDITEQKQAQSKIQEQLVRLDLLNRITRAIGERLDLPSIFQVVIRSLEDNLPIDFICLCVYDQPGNVLRVTNIGLHCEALAIDLALSVKDSIPIDQNGLSRCLAGKLVYEPNVADIPFPFPQRLKKGGLRSLVAAPLLVESKVFGVLIVARRQAAAFSSPDCEFLRQLSEHVALAAHQAQIYSALQQAYDELRETQQSVMQQERMRVLGQMASGIAHDINNAISPVALYTESLLEREPGLSARTREYLETIKRAIEDVAHTVGRMREFYRQREVQLTLAPVDLNEMVRHVMDLSRVRWSDMPQQRGIVIETYNDLQRELPTIMAVASEVREALINLVFNAVDAMPEGGTITIRTKVVDAVQDVSGVRARQHVRVDVVDTGGGMDEETRRRCLEPFFTTKGERGTGLGLAMVYGMMQRHNAEVEIESAPGKGTTIGLCFPLLVKESAPQASAVVYAVLSRLRILLVDDDPLILKSLRDTLEGDGHLIVTANEGRAGITAFSAALKADEAFALVITDLGMPYVDGRKVASAVKGFSPTTPVILLTGWGQRLIAEGDIPPHVDCVLNKPPKLSELRQAIAKCCRPAEY